ncbi:MAG TPA: hypothetical protein VFO66_02405 [Gemmatimonadaceae bacterium]|nr:hypothetical protein [Gemmatimonadaceae bacterium]
MSNETNLPTEVTTLLHRALPSMVHIELLLLLFRTGPRSWALNELAIELRSSPDLVAAALTDLETSRLAEKEPGMNPPKHRFDAREATAIQAVALLQTIYDRRPVTLIKALYKRPPSSVTAFADAFRLRSDS